MEILETKKNDFTILALEGRLDTLSSASLDSKLKDLMDKNENKIIIDLTNLNFISSSGLRVLLTIAKTVKGEGKLALCSLQEHVKEVFDVAGFTMLFAIFSSKDEAVKSLL